MRGYEMTFEEFIGVYDVMNIGPFFLMDNLPLTDEEWKEVKALGYTRQEAIESFGMPPEWLYELDSVNELLDTEKEIDLI
jgi:hypothetical protein